MDCSTEEIRHWSSFFVFEDKILNFLNLADFPFVLVTTSLVLVPTILIYYTFFKPLNICRDLTGVGFDYLKDGSQKTVEHKILSKTELVKNVQRRRGIGDLPPVFPNGWFVLLESKDLKKEEVKHVMALGENFAVFRTGTGEVHILDAYCPHLGANMAIGGVVRGSCLECPFHKWQFNGEDGSCAKVPYSKSRPNTATAKKWISTEINDLIFVWYHAENEEPTWNVEQNYSLASGEWVFHGRSDFLVGCHIQEIPENGADIGHLDALHGASFLTGMDIRNSNNPMYKFFKHGWSASWEQSTTEPHKGILSLTSEARVFDNYLLNRLEAKVQQVGPGYVELLLLAPWGPMLLLQTVTPLEPLKQRVIHRIYSSPCTAPLSKIAMYMETIMFARDVMVWNHKKYLSKPVLVKEDGTLVRHRRWYQQFYSKNSPRFQYRKDDLDW